MKIQFRNHWKSLKRKDRKSFILFAFDFTIYLKKIMGKKGIVFHVAFFNFSWMIEFFKKVK